MSWGSKLAWRSRGTSSSILPVSVITLLVPVSVPAVAGPAFSSQVMVHLGIERPLGQSLLQFVEQAIGVKRRLRISPSQKLIQYGIGDLRFLASRHS
jgi:hypothetical protein